MNSTLLWQEASNAMPKLFSPALGFRRLWLLALLLIAIFFSGCKCDDVKPDDRNFCGTMPGDGCNTNVTVRNAICGSGIWGSMWLQLDNGTYLQPWETSVSLPKTVEEGQRFRINYDITTRNNVQHPGATCLAMPPAAEPIRINCIDAQPASNCNVYATATNSICGLGYWGSIWLKLEDGTFIQPWEVSVSNFRIVEGKRYKIGYEKMNRDSRYDGTITCMAMPPAADAVRILCIKEAVIGGPN